MLIDLYTYLPLTILALIKLRRYNFLIIRYTVALGIFVFLLILNIVEDFF